MDGRIRKVITVTEELSCEGGLRIDPPQRRAAALAVVANPWRGRGYVADLRAEVSTLCPQIARVLGERLLGQLGGRDNVEAYGKAVLVGVDGETEHGAALIHTPFLGDLFRHLVDGTSIIAFSETRGPAGTPLSVPMCHKTASATRSHYQAIEVRIGDAPRPDEIVVVLAAAAAGRPFARIGDRSTDDPVQVEAVLA